MKSVVSPNPISLLGEPKPFGYNSGSHCRHIPRYSHISPAGKAKVINARLKNAAEGCNHPVWNTWEALITCTFNISIQDILRHIRIFFMFAI